MRLPSLFISSAIAPLSSLVIPKREPIYTDDADSELHEVLGTLFGEISVPCPVVPSQLPPIQPEPELRNPTPILYSTKSSLTAVPRTPAAPESEEEGEDFFTGMTFGQGRKRGCGGFADRKVKRPGIGELSREDLTEELRTNKQELRLELSAEDGEKLMARMAAELKVNNQQLMQDLKAELQAENRQLTEGIKADREAELAANRKGDEVEIPVRNNVLNWIDWFWAKYTRG